MIIRQLKPEKYEQLYRQLIQSAQPELLSASYTVELFINHTEYQLKLQPESHCRLAALQALRICRNGDTPEFELITKGNLLSSLLEIWVDQGLKSA
ncbi:hypothetical protein [Clostridium minihomine]|uniref:hypothetical protein n=1 Tax=Clostridium minihomine TaxID=2045012 RepID=UPI000C760332|nr:hypothetical protein [Clostridium minihomine]